MSTKEEMTTVESPGESMSFSERLKSLSVRWKIRIAYWAGIILTACLVIIMVTVFSAERLFIMDMIRYTCCGASRQNSWRHGLNDWRIK